MTHAALEWPFVVVWLECTKLGVVTWQRRFISSLNRLTPNDTYMGRTAPLTSKYCILYICSTYISNEYFKHALYSPSFSLQNAVCFIMLTCLVPVLFTFLYTRCAKIKKKNNSGVKGLILSPTTKWQYLDLQPSACERLLFSVGSFYMLSAPMPL